MRKRLIITSAVVAGILLIGGGTAVAVGYTAPAPVVEEKITTVEPKVEAPAPAPVVEAPVTEPAPVVEAPAPIVEAPAPAPAPVQVAPAPAPVVEAPAPYVPRPMPQTPNGSMQGTCAMTPTEGMPTCQ